MANVIKHAYQQSSDQLTISCYDWSGIYNALTNTGGYGAPNLAVGAFTYCTLDIYAPDPVTLLPQSTITVSLDMYPTLPNVTGTPFVIDSVAVLGSSQVFPIGWYRMVVTQSEDYPRSVNYVTDDTIPIIGSLMCCINNLILSASLCGCEGTNNDKLLEAKMFLDQLDVPTGRTTGDLSNIENCGLINKGAQIMLMAQAICDSENCGTCSTCG